MNRNLLGAVGRLRSRGALPDPQAAFLERVARGGLVSVRLEIRIALWAGVTMIAGAAGLLVREHLADIGPVMIGGGIALAALGCLGYVARTAPPFSRGPVPSPNIAFDYLLLLGVLLVGTDLAWLETQLKLLGPAWPWHLLALSLVQLAFAFRYDSRAVLSLALASFAAWRGISLSLAAGARFGAHDDLLRLNALLVGATFAGAGVALRRTGVKEHFEPALGNAALLLVLGAAVSGSFSGRGFEPLWHPSLVLLAGGVIALSWRQRRSDYFAQGVIAAYLGFLRLATEVRFGVGYFSLVSAGSFVALFLILWARRRFKGGR